MVPSDGLAPPPHGARTRHAPLTPRRVWSDGGIRTRTSRLGRPAGDRYPTFARFGRAPSRPAERGPVSLTGPSTSVGCQRPRSLGAHVSCEHTSLANGPARLRAGPHQTKRPSGGSTLEGLVLARNAGLLGCGDPHGAREGPTAATHRARMLRGSERAGGRPLDAGQAIRPRKRRRDRIGELRDQLEPRVEKVRAALRIVNGKARG